MITLGSLFDGIGGWQLAAVRNGVKPLWSSEIDPFPASITKKHFPDTIQLGDVTKINGAEIPPVDIICAGSPCQDLSIAGKRAVLEEIGQTDIPMPASGRWARAGMVRSKGGAESHGERSMLNFGASPSTERESSLSQVLESGGGTYRYSLTPKACAGILRRAKAKGKKLPELLEAVLEWQAHDGD